MSTYTCKRCDDRTCCNGSGTVRVFDTEDGPNTYSCQCWCARQARRRQDEDREINALIRKYGVERVRAAVEAVQS